MGEPGGAWVTERVAARRRSTPERVSHAPTVVPGSNSERPKPNEQLLLSTSKQKASKSRVTRAEVAIEKSLEQGTRSLRLQARQGFAPHAAVRGLVRGDLEGTSRILAQPLRDAGVPMNRGKELVTFGKEPERQYDGKAGGRVRCEPHRDPSLGKELLDTRFVPRA